MAPSRRTIVTTVTLVIVGLIGTAVGSGGSTIYPERVGRRLLAGGQQFFGGIGRGVGNTIRSVAELRQLRSDYEGLLAEVELYRRLEGTVQNLERENRRLREQLGFAARTEQRTLSARVIAKEGAGALFSSFTINRGIRHGVEENQAVVAFIAGREGLVGRVAEVSGGTALIVPIFSAGSYVASRLDRSRYEGLVQGTGDGSDALLLRYIPREARNEIGYDDLVITSGLQSMFPPGLPIGRVRGVEVPSFETALLVNVEPIIDFSRLEYVFVLLQAGTSR